MGVEVKNGLVGARSAYLRSAMHQPVEWNEWGSEAFAKAKAEDKPILLDIGAVWCHWCHVMDRESYENAETAGIINEHFVAVKVDRDERPDVDARYQAAVAAISGQGGWPLTAFLMPDGRPYFGGTYFPPIDGHGRPSLRRVLLTMAEAFEKRRDEVDDTAGGVMAAIEHNESIDGIVKNPGNELVEKIVASALQQFDPRFGGFGSQPKFPNAGAIDLLIDQAGREVHEQKAGVTPKHAVLLTLEKMSRGGIYDHLAGGFHRYSVDERWVVPHFEKMSYDNSELLRNFVHAYQSFREPQCLRVAGEMIAWIDESMSDRERGGFYASQDADESLEDDGDYFTWTRREAEQVLNADELAVAEAYFDLGPLGDMHHNPEKNVLHVNHPPSAVAKSLGMPVDRATALVGSAKEKLFAARKLRKTPYIDRTVYVAWNAMMCSAYLEAGRVLGRPDTTAFGLKSLDRALAEGWDGQLMRHVVTYGDVVDDGERVAGVLEDYVFSGHAALDGWECTGELRYFSIALKLCEAAVRKFFDEAQGGFFDTEFTTEPRLGALSARRKPMQDSPTPAGNSVAASLLLRVAEMTGRNDLREKAKVTLECFAGVVEHLGLYAASYGLALRRLVEAPTQVVIVGAGDEADELESIALERFAVNKGVLRLRSKDVALPPALAETVPHLPISLETFAVVCKGFACGLPMTSAMELRAVLAEGILRS